MIDSDFIDFTEKGFKSLIAALKGTNYRFADFVEPGDGRHVLWRHDVDCSMHRAAALSRIEAAAGARATYFVNPRSNFYSLAEPAVVNQLQTILANGHEVGLHFDAGAYGVKSWDLSSLTGAIERERSLVETIAGRPIRVLSWHDPDLSNLLDFTTDRICGLVNAYGESLRAAYHYASDSNGYWRFRPMVEVIAQGHERLHLLTHPEWWTPEAMTPWARIERCIDGRAAAVRSRYNASFPAGDRINAGQAR